MVISRNILPLAVVSLALALATGCDSGPKDVTSDPAFGDFKSVVGAWQTRVPLRLVEIGKELYLVFGDQFISASHELPAVPIGTEIRIEHLIFRRTFETTFLDATGSFVAGPYAGKTLWLDSRLFAPDLVFHNDLHHGDPSNPPWNWTVAPEKLERPASASAPQK